MITALCKELYGGLVDIFVGRWTRLLSHHCTWMDRSRCTGNRYTVAASLFFHVTTSRGMMKKTIKSNGRTDTCFASVGRERFQLNDMKCMVIIVLVAGKRYDIVGSH